MANGARIVAGNSRGVVWYCRRPAGPQWELHIFGARPWQPLLAHATFDSQPQALAAFKEYAVVVTQLAAD